MIYWRLADRFLYLVKLIELIFNLDHVSTQYKTICTISKKEKALKVTKLINEQYFFQKLNLFPFGISHFYASETKIWLRVIPSKQKTEN